MKALSEELYEAVQNMKLIQQRMMTRHDKVEVARLMLIEEHLEMVARAIEALIKKEELHGKLA